MIDETVYVSPDFLSSIKGLRVPDMLIAFDADPEVCARRNAYVITEQGKPPDIVLEVASRSTGQVDVQDKPADYSVLDIPEYWRFDKIGESHGARLAGNWLATGWSGTATSPSRLWSFPTTAWRTVARCWT